METTLHEVLKQCKKLVCDPAARREYLLNLRAQGRPLAGYFSNYIPEEILAAAGFHPVRIIGTYSAAQSHSRPLFNPICSFVQDTYRAAAAGEFSEMKRVVFPNSCDSLKVLRDLWNGEIKTPPAYALLHPVAKDRDSILYFADQLRCLAAELNSNFNSDAFEAALHHNIERYNQTRRQLRQLYDLRQTGRFLKGSDAVALMTAGLILDRDEYNVMLHQVIEFGQQTANTVNAPKRIMIVGPLLDHIPLLETIEQLGVSIIYEDITNGARYCDRDVALQGDLYENLAARYLLALPSPTLNDTAQSHQADFEKCLGRLKPDGVIFINQKFCEPHVHNYLAQNEILKRRGISSMMLEIEHGRLDVQQRDRLRIESFIEMMGNK